PRRLASSSRPAIAHAPLGPMLDEPSMRKTMVLPRAGTPKKVVAAPSGGPPASLAPPGTLPLSLAPAADGASSGPALPKEAPTSRAPGGPSLAPRRRRGCVAGNDDDCADVAPCPVATSSTTQKDCSVTSPSPPCAA